MMLVLSVFRMIKQLERQDRVEKIVNKTNACNIFELWRVQYGKKIPFLTNTTSVIIFYNNIDKEWMLPQSNGIPLRVG